MHSITMGRNVSILLMIVIMAMVSETQGSCPASLVTRSEWGARPTKSSSPLKNPVQYAFIHHTYSPAACYTKADCIRKVKGIQNYHMDSNGWDDIGYSFLVGSDGHVYEGRGWNRVGAHTYRYNSVGIGIAVIGDYTMSVPNRKALETVQALLACGVSNGALKSNYIVRGHRDMVKTTECPGQAFYSLIKTWPHY